MELAALLGKFKTGEAEPKKFLALVITSDVVQAAVWHVVEGRTELVTTGSPIEWGGDTTSPGALLSAVDATISGATEGLTKEPTEVIFGVTSDWVEADKLKAPKLAIIKQICDELELKALGFVDILDSVIRQLKLEEGTPTTSLLIQVFQKSVTAYHVVQGKVIATSSLERTPSIVTDVEGALLELAKGFTLPSRILVFDGMQDLSTLVQQLVANDWSKHFNFLHIPQVTALPRDVIIRSVAVAGGAEVAVAIGFTMSPPQKATPASPPPRPEEDSVTEVELAKPTALGFTSTSTSPPGSLPKVVPKKTKPTFVLPRFKLPHFTWPSLRLPRGTHFLLPFLAVFLLIALYFSALWFVPHAHLRLSVSPRSINEPLTLTLDPSLGSVDISSHRVPVQILEHSVTGDATSETTGHKLVGDPSRGTVTLYNRTSLSKTFTKGTLLTSANLKFTLDSDVTVASKTAGVDYVDVPGKNTVKITASTIGADSNLASGSEFVIGAFSKDTYVAKNDTALSGGTSKEAQVVAKEDQANLLKSLQTKLLSQASDELSSRAEPGTGIYLLAGSAKLDSTSYSQPVGAEATELQATTTLSLSAVQYHLADVESLVSDVISQSIPPGFMRLNEPPVVELSQLDQATLDNLEVTAKVTVNLIPSLKSADIATRIRGAKLSDLAKLLSDIPGYQGSVVTFTPTWLNHKLEHLPRRPQNISLDIESSP